MCGIVVSTNRDAVERGLDATGHRGPDGRGIVTVGDWHLGHVRLAIQDTTGAAHQPMVAGQTTISYNGELWNAPALRDKLGDMPWRSTGDTEVLAYWLDRGLPVADLDGQFAVCWVDGAGVLHAARDRYGEVPLHFGITPSKDVVIASELKALRAAGVAMSTVQWVAPGATVTFGGDRTYKTRSWHRHTETSPATTDPAGTLDSLLGEAVTKRFGNSDVPVCALVSGGIDSSAVLWHAVDQGVEVTAYTAVFDRRSKDLALSRAVCSELGVPLVEVPVASPTADDLAAVVDMIEMPHKAQVEIGWLCVALAKAISSDGFKVVLSGEGSDELWASYGMSYHGVQKDGWLGHRANSVLGQHRKNWARVNKVFMASSVEGRLPFADRDVVPFGLGLSEQAVRPGRKEKWVLRGQYRGRLPQQVVERPKAAFQTEAKIPEAIARGIADPARLYKAEFGRLFGKVKP